MQTHKHAHTHTHTHTHTHEIKIKLVSQENPQVTIGYFTRGPPHIDSLGCY